MHFLALCSLLYALDSLRLLDLLSQAHLKGKRTQALDFLHSSHGHTSRRNFHE